MKSPGMFPKVAALASFTLLITVFVAYRAGVFEQLPNDNPIGAVSAEGKDSTEGKDSLDSRSRDSLQKHGVNTISVAPARMPVPKIKLVDSAGGLQIKTLTVEDSVPRKRRDMEMMSTSKSIRVFGH